MDTLRNKLEPTHHELFFVNFLPAITSMRSGGTVGENKEIIRQQKQ